MLQDIRENAQGTIAKVIIGLLIISLSAWGLESLVGGSGEPNVAVVDGDEISEREFQRTVQMEQQRRLRDMDSNDASQLDEDQIRKEVLEALVQERVLASDAAGQGLELSEEDVDQLITQMSQFQTDGRFDRDRFAMTVRNMGMDVAEFRRAMRTQFVVNQIRGGISQSGVVSPETIESLLRIQYQTRDFRTLSLNADSVRDQVSVSDEDVEAYYEENREDYMLPERVDVEYIVLSLEALAENTEVSDDELQTYYEEQRDDLEASEERRTAHILIEDQDEADSIMEEIQQKLDDGAEFSEMAREYSDDAASARDGGDLGFAGREMFDSAYEEVMYDLEEGEVSEPVETSFGVHLIKLLEVRRDEAPALEEVEDELRRELAAEKAGEKFAEMRSDLADRAYSASDLQDPAEVLDLDIQTRDGLTEEGGDAPFDHQGLMRQIFSEDVKDDGFNSEMIDVEENVSVVARVAQSHPREERPLAEVEDEIRDRLTDKAIREALTERARDVIARLQDGESVEELDIEAGEWQEYADLMRNNPTVDRDVLQQVFSMARPEDGKPQFGLAESGNDIVIIALDDVANGEVQENPEELRQLRRFLADQQGQREYNAYQEYLRDRAEVERP